MIVAGLATRDKDSAGWESAHYAYSPNGSMTHELFKDWAEKFVEKTGATLDKPSVLLLDNHSSHHYPWAIGHLLEHGVRVVFLPAFTTHILCPLDVSFFRSFKAALSSKAKERYPELHSFKTTQLLECAKSAYRKTSAILFKDDAEGGGFERKSSVISGFRAAGIYPFDPMATHDKIYRPEGEMDVHVAAEPVVLPSKDPEEIRRRAALIKANFALYEQATIGKKKSLGFSRAVSGEAMAERFIAKQKVKAEVAQAKALRLAANGGVPRRGRPPKKKKAASETDEEPSEAEDVEMAEPVATTSAPRKRGRPRKDAGLADAPPAKKPRKK